MKKLMSSLANNLLSVREMKTISGGQGGNVMSFSCTAANGAGFTGVGTQSDLKTMVLLYCGPCQYSCRYS